MTSTVSNYEPSKEQEEDGASNNRCTRILYIPHEGPPIRWDNFVLCTADLHDEMTLSGVKYKLVEWGIVEEHRIEILDLITSYLNATEVDTRENARLIPFHIDINRLVAFWTNSNQSSGELDPSRNGAISALDQMKEDDCGICMNGLAGSKAAELLSCGHILHACCLYEWLWRN